MLIGKSIKRFTVSAGALLVIYWVYWAVAVSIRPIRPPDLVALLMFPLLLGALAGGYGAALRVMTPRLRSDAAPSGRRGTVAGVAAVGLFVTAIPFIEVATPGWTYAQVQLMSAAVALCLALAAGTLAALWLFFPWLLPSAEQGTHETTGAIGAATDLAALSCGTRDVGRDRVRRETARVPNE